MGRVFSLYDMLYNVAYVIGPAIAVPFLPDTGKSYQVVVAIGAVYLAAAVIYATLTLRRAGGGAGSPSDLSPPQKLGDNPVAAQHCPSSIRRSSTNLPAPCRPAAPAAGPSSSMISLPSISGRMASISSCLRSSPIRSSRPS